MKQVPKLQGISIKLNQIPVYQLPGSGLASRAHAPGNINRTSPRPYNTAMKVSNAASVASNLKTHVDQAHWNTTPGMAGKY